MGNTVAWKQCYHFSALRSDYNAVVIDPSGWEPIQLLFADPWSEHGRGTPRIQCGSLRWYHKRFCLE
jgi:hypothetical protein